MAQAYSRTWLFADAPGLTLDVNCESIMDQWSCNRNLATGKGPDPVLDETRKKIANQSWPQLEIAVGRWKVGESTLLAGWCLKRRKGQSSSCSDKQLLTPYSQSLADNFVSLNQTGTGWGARFSLAALSALMMLQTSSTFQAT